MVGPRGPRSILKRNDYIERPAIKFQVWVVKRAEMKRKELVEILTLAQDNGLGACRSQGYGKFDVVALEKM